jgi:hypothetical protein
MDHPYFPLRHIHGFARGYKNVVGVILRVRHTVAEKNVGKKRLYDTARLDFFESKLRGVGEKPAKSSTAFIFQNKDVSAAAEGQATISPAQIAPILTIRLIFNTSPTTGQTAIQLPRLHDFEHEHKEGDIAGALVTAMQIA